MVIIRARSCSFNVVESQSKVIFYPRSLHKGYRGLETPYIHRAVPVSKLWHHKSDICVHPFKRILSPDFPLSEVISYYRDSTETATNPHKRPANEEERLRSLTRSYTVLY